MQSRGKRLAMRTIYRTAPGNDGTFERRATVWAGSAGTPVDGQKGGVAIIAASSVQIIGGGDLVFINGKLKRLRDLPCQQVKLRIGKGAGWRAGMNMECIQCFVGINVPDSGDNRLIEQAGLDSSLAAVPMLG